jgi:integrase
LRKLLTDSFLRAVKPPAQGRTEIVDLRTPGLTFRVTASGARTWAYRFRDQQTGDEGRAKIGAYPSITLEAARAKAGELQAIVADGGNPTRNRKAAAGGPESFEALAERYLEQYARRKKRSHKRDEQNLRNHILPVWGRRPYASITRPDVVELVEGVIARGHDTLANRLHSLISTIFTFALDAGDVTSHPCFRLSKRGVERVGDRVLSDAELRLFWRNVIEPPAVRRTGLALRLILLTGVRVSEAAGLARSQLENLAEPDQALWIIPGQRTKRHRLNKAGPDHVLPLSPLARETILELLAMIEPAEQWLLPTRSRQRKGHMRGNSLTQAMDFFGDRLAGNDDAIRTWLAERPTPHDLRRTVETRMAALGVSKETRDRCLNHVPTDTGSKHYNRHDYVTEKREAFTRWSNVLGSILHGTGATVVPLATRIGLRGNAN